MSSPTNARQSSGQLEEKALPVVYFLGGFHPSNESFIRSPPSNVTMRSRVGVQEFVDFGKLKQYSGSWPILKRVMDMTFNTLRMPRMMPVLGKYDLIHTNGSLIPISKSPWVASMENPSAFYGFREYWHKSYSTKKVLAQHLLSDRCRAILPYSHAGKKYLLMCLHEWEQQLSKKTHVLELAIDPYLVGPERAAKKEDGPFTFLFVGTHFFDKGGREVLRAFRHVREMEKSRLIMVTSAPQHQKKEFEEYVPTLKAEKQVEYYPTGLPRSKLLEIYRSSDVFVFPSYMDQVPFVLLEAMASGLPMIGSNSYAVPEMVIENVNGFNVESPWVAFPTDRPRTEEHLAAYRKAVLDERNFDGVVEQLIDKMGRLMGSAALRDKFGAESLRLVREGKYSIGARNEKLSRIYDQAIHPSG